MRATVVISAILAVFLCACGSPSSNEVNVYTHRHYPADKELFANFTKETGIKVNVIQASADELINRIETEGDKSPADILITVDAGRLYRAKSKGLLQAVDSKLLNERIPSHLRDSDNMWFGMTKRARVIVYSKERVDPSELTTYADLVDEKWRSKILIRSSSNVYNQSLLASFATQDSAAAAAWATGMVANFAREPKGNDRGQIAAVAAGEGDLAIVNHYYLAMMLNSDDADQKAAAEKVGIFFPDQEGNGTHVNVSGVGVAKYSKNRANAIRFMEYLTNAESQKLFAEGNYEFPVVEGSALSATLSEWAGFKEQTIQLNDLGVNNSRAVRIFDAVGWR